MAVLPLTSHRETCPLPEQGQPYRKTEGSLCMTQQCSFPQRARPFDLQLTQGKLSRRTVLGRMAGLIFIGGSLIPFTASCGTVASSPSTTSQTPPAPALGKTLYTYRGHRSMVTAVAWSPDGRRIVSASYDGTAQVWDALTGSGVLTYRRHFGTVNAVTWSPDGKRIASGSLDETVQVWQAQ